MKFLKIFFWNIFFIILLFLILELTVRLTFRDIHLSGTSSNLLIDSVYNNSAGLKPNSSGESYGVIKKVDPNGFLYYNKLNRKKIKAKWLFLGDSVTMGIGVENDSSFAGLIDTDIDTIKVLNTALIGYSSSDYLNIMNKIFKRDRNSLGVDDVYLFWCLNDVYDFYPTSNSPDYRRKGLIGKVISFISTNFKTWHLFKNVFADRQKDYFLYDYQFYKLSDIRFKKALDNINTCTQIAHDFGVDFKIIILPYEYQVRNFDKKELFEPQILLSHELHNSGITCLDISKYFKNISRQSKSFYLFGDGIHFSEKGHKLISKILLSRFLN